MLNRQQSEIQRTRIQSLLDAARAQGSRYTQVFPAGIPVTMSAPTIVGPGQCDEITGVTREVFVTALNDATVRGGSSAIAKDGTLIFDYQGHEIDRIGTEAHADEFVVEGQAVYAFHDAWPEASLELAEALTLLGSSAVHFGHWIIEYLLRWTTAVDTAHIGTIPILIDEALPAADRQSLEYFSRGNGTLMAIPGGATVRVRKLWTASNWIYVPIYWKNEAAIDPRSLVWPAAEVAKRYRKLASRGDDDLIGWNGGPKIYFARRRSRRRRLLNDDRIERLAREYGYVVVYPEDFDFRDQMRYVRTATHIMGPEGSALFLAFFAPAGTKLCGFSHPFVAKAGFVATLLKELNIEAVLVTGDYVRKDELFPRFSDYVIEENAVRSVLEEWHS